MSLTYVADAKRRSHDPTGTGRLRASFRAAGQLQLRQLRAQLRMCIIDHDLLGWSGTNISIMASAPDVRLGAFSHWLTSAATKYLGSDWATPFLDRAWRMGVAAAARELGSDPMLHQARGHVPHQLLRQELRGIIAAIVQQTAREAARNFSTPHRAWQHLSRCFDKVAGNRIMALANTETVRAFNMAKLAVYSDRGITHVGIDPELMPPIHDHVADRTLYGIETANDERVCAECQDLEDESPYTLGQALGLIPAHVGCRCAYTPWTGAVDAVPSDHAGLPIVTVRDYDPGQPRVPSGSPEGGEFGSTGSATYGELVASRNITSKKAKTEGVAYARPDVEAMRLSPKNYKADVDLFSNGYAYPNFRPGELHGTPDERVQTIIEHFKSNLKFIYDNAGEATRKSGMSWYDKAHDLAVADARAFDIEPRSAAAVIATLSPQKDWNENIYLAHRVMEINSKQREHQWDEAMAATAARIWKPKDQELVDAVQGKKLGELSDPAEKAVWIRTYDEAHNDRSYRDFDTGEVVMNQPKGKQPAKPSSAAWQSIENVAAAVGAMDSKGDMTVISAELGKKHKVRSFYNNIIAPHAPHGDVTVDTHAIGAALFRPLTGKDTGVMHGLATGPKRPPGPRGKDWKPPPGWKAASGSAVTGVQGTYGIYADAYRAVAKDLGIQPQQLQAVTWQAKRQMFDLSDKKLDAVEQEWVNYHKGVQDLKQTQNNVLSIARA